MVGYIDYTDQLKAFLVLNSDDRSLETMFIYFE